MNTLPDQSPRGLLVRPVIWAALGLVILFIAAVVVMSRFKFEPPDGSKAGLDDFGTVPNVVLTERSGQSLALDDLHGSAWIADFIFTYCTGPCPLMTARMAELQKEFHDIEGLKFVSFSVDPDRDTPERLREYATIYNADSQRWLFLVAPKDTMDDLASARFHMAASGDLLLHSTLFALVDQKGHIRNYYHIDDPQMKAKMRADVLALLGRGPSS
jgi:protein SCO1/2